MKKVRNTSKVIDLCKIREILNEEEAEIKKIKDLGLFIFGEDELQYV